jgi:hypothetical protein
MKTYLDALDAAQKGRTIEYTLSEKWNEIMPTKILEEVRIEGFS